MRKKAILFFSLLFCLSISFMMSASLQKSYAQQEVFERGGQYTILNDDLMDFTKALSYNNLITENNPSFDLDDKSYVKRAWTGSGELVYSTRQATESIIYAAAVISGFSVEVYVSSDSGQTFGQLSTHIATDGVQQSWVWQSYKYSITLPEGTTHLKIMINSTNELYNPLVQKVILQSDEPLAFTELEQSELSVRPSGYIIIDDEMTDLSKAAYHSDNVIAEYNPNIPAPDKTVALRNTASPGTLVYAVANATEMLVFTGGYTGVDLSISLDNGLTYYATNPVCTQTGFYDDWYATYKYSYTFTGATHIKIEFINTQDIWLPFIERVVIQTSQTDYIEPSQAQLAEMQPSKRIIDDDLVNSTYLTDSQNIYFETLSSVPFDQTYIKRAEIAAAYICYNIYQATELIFYTVTLSPQPQISLLVSIDGGESYFSANANIAFLSSSGGWSRYQYSYTFGQGATHIKIVYSGAYEYDPLIQRVILQSEDGSPLDINPQAVYNNVSYGSHSRQKMDIHLPGGDYQEVPVIMFIHGGGWTEGDKSAMLNHCLKAVEWGYAAVTINYRRTAENAKLTDMIDDIKAAFSYIESNAQLYKIKTENAAIGGHSAGAHLAMLYAYMVTDSPIDINLVFSMSGPADFTNPFYYTSTINAISVRQMFAKITGDTYYGTIPQSWISASPITHVKTQSPYSIFVYGTTDDLVPSSEGERMQQKFTQSGAGSELILISGGDHMSTFNMTLQILNPLKAALNIYLPK